MSSFKQARKKRHWTTSSWLLDTDDYRNWLVGEFSLFWCSGLREYPMRLKLSQLQLTHGNVYNSWDRQDRPHVGSFVAVRIVYTDIARIAPALSMIYFIAMPR